MSASSWLVQLRTFCRDSEVSACDICVRIWSETVLPSSNRSQFPRTRTRAVNSATFSNVESALSIRRPLRARCREEQSLDHVGPAFVAVQITAADAVAAKNRALEQRELVVAERAGRGDHNLRVL